MELQTQILLSEKLGYISEKEAKEIVELNEEIIKMLYSMVAKQ